MSREHLLAVEPPNQYDFSNWDEFYREALRYHEMTRPNDRRVIDRIETFRKFMSGDVIQHLGGFVRSHPRFGTVDGWDQWVTNVKEALRAQDPTIGRTLTFGSCAANFKAGKASERDFWEGLDMLVSRGDISSDEQRQCFWEAHSWETQERLAERCPFFDPRHEIWASGNSCEIAEAERVLSQIMEFSLVDEKIALVERGLKYACCAEVLLVVPTVASFVVMTVADRTFHDDLALTSFFFAILCASLMVVILVLLIAALIQRRSLQNEQRDIRTIEPA